MVDFAAAGIAAVAVTLWNYIQGDMHYASRIGRVTSDRRVEGLLILMENSDRIPGADRVLPKNVVEDLRVHGGATRGLPSQDGGRYFQPGVYQTLERAVRSTRIIGPLSWMSRSAASRRVRERLDRAIGYVGASEQDLQLRGLVR